MSIADRITQMEVELQQVQNSIKEKEAKALEIKAKLEFAKELVEEVANEFKEEAEKRNECVTGAINTLFLAHRTGSITDGDLFACYSETGIAPPEELQGYSPPEEEDAEEEHRAA